MLVRALILLPLLLACASPVQAQTRTYCCTDTGGRRTCGDTLPAICYDRAYVELLGGRVVREVEGPLTPEQRVKRDGELRAQRDKVAKEATARRRDQVLLDSYATVSELDRRRDRDVGNLEGEIRAARAREADLMAQSAKMEKQKPAKGAIPRALSENLAVNASELEAIRQVITSKQREIGQIKERFESDRERYLELTEPSPPPPRK
jgi:hypothetical protein